MLINFHSLPKTVVSWVRDAFIVLHKVSFVSKIVVAISKNGIFRYAGSCEISA